MDKNVQRQKKLKKVELKQKTDVKKTKVRR